MDDPRIIVSLDYSNTSDALSLADRLTPAHCRLKVGKALSLCAGPELITALHRRGYDVFLDLKFHDIPHTVANACAIAGALGVWMVNVHAIGGKAMLYAAQEMLDKKQCSTQLVAVTVLTSLRQADLPALGIHADLDEQVSRLAQLTKQCGLAGVVCSAQEVQRLRTECGPDFCLVTPGIRPHGSSYHDQKRAMTPAAAIDAGSDYLVIGRPITQAKNPLRALLDIEKSITHHKTDHAT